MHMRNTLMVLVVFGMRGGRGFALAVGSGKAGGHGCCSGDVGREGLEMGVQCVCVYSTLKFVYCRLLVICYLICMYTV